MIRTRVFVVDPFNPDPRAIAECASILRKGGTVVFPTETVYGLGARAYDPQAVSRIYVAKGRPLDNPLIVHISSLDQLFEVASSVPEEGVKLVEKLWPGPLTIVVPKSQRVPKEVTAGLPTVAVRMPAHPVALNLIEALGEPIAAPSANISGRPSPTSGRHVLIDMFGRVDAIIDAGETPFGVESTIVNLATDPPTLLRPGPIPVEKIVEILGREVRVPDFARGLGEAERALAPGTRYRHYAPQTKLVVVEGDYARIEEYAEAVARVAEDYRRKGLRVAIVASRETADVYRSRGFRTLVIGSRSNLYEVAHNLFETLRKIDELGVDIAVCEGFEERGIGLAIMNRLRKASGFNVLRV